MASILVVDDDELLRRLLVELLESAGHVVRSSSNGYEGLQELRRFSPDILLSDLRMPVMSGRELLREVRELYPTITVIVVSGDYPSNTDMPEGVIADRFYVKGQQHPGDLLREIDRLLSERQSARAGTQSSEAGV